jgi:hypothetical protein
MQSSPFAILRQFALPALLVLLGTLGCKGKDNTGVTLFVFDGSSSSVKVWDDVNKVQTAFAEGTEVPAPDRTISSTSVMGSITLAWGGLALDNAKNILYLVTETGTVFVIPNADAQNGDISSTSNITSFTLGTSSDYYSSGAFGQAAVDSSTNTLYVLETSLDGSQTQVWYVPNASQQFNQTSTPENTFSAASDQWGVGLAAHSGNVYGLFGAGNAVYNSQGTPYTGPRLRLGQNYAFPASSDVLIGATTGLPGPVNFGSLAFDSQNSILYVWAQAANPDDVLMFTQNQFILSGFDQAPSKTLSDTSATLANLRLIAHSANSDWLLGADMPTPALTGAGTSTLHIWKNPSGGGVSAVSGTLSVAPEIRGMAIGGN